jgi:adenylate cyclase
MRVLREFHAAMGKLILAHEGVTNLAARLWAEAQAGQIWLSARVASEVEALTETDEIGALALKGFARPVPAFRLVRLKPGA